MLEFFAGLLSMVLDVFVWSSLAEGSEHGRLARTLALTFGCVLLLLLAVIGVAMLCDRLAS